jgi:hypothetical protein
MSTTLDELRKLNIAQRKKDAASPDTGPDSLPAEPGAPEEATGEAETPAADAQVRKSASPQVRKSAQRRGTAEPVPVETVPSVTETPTRKSAEKSRRGRVEPEGEFLERIRDRIVRKRIHGGGVKASVDLDPDLSLRAKRYCLEHGNMPLRVLFIELLSAFLEEEGY